MADDEQRDEVLRRKLSLLRWVREEHLDIKPTDFNEQYIRNAADGRAAHPQPAPGLVGARPLTAAATSTCDARRTPKRPELLKLNRYKAPRDKVICILNCCKIIYSMGWPGGRRGPCLGAPHLWAVFGLRASPRQCSCARWASRRERTRSCRY